MYASATPAEVSIVGNSRVLDTPTLDVRPRVQLCGFRKPARKAKGQVMCPVDVPVGTDRGACLYASSKRYRYWERSDEHRTLTVATQPASGCSFGGPQWQLWVIWVNHTLAHAEAAARGAKHAVFAVCAPAANQALLGGDVLGAFRAQLTRPSSLVFVSLDDLIRRIEVAAATDDSRRVWAVALAKRYAKV